MRTIGVLVLCALAAFAGPFDKKKKKDGRGITQVLQLPKDPPSAVTAETARLVFHVSPLSAKGLLSQQVRDALKALPRERGRRDHREAARVCGGQRRPAARAGHRERNLYRTSVCRCPR